MTIYSVMPLMIIVRANNMHLISCILPCKCHASVNEHQGSRAWWRKLGSRLAPAGPAKPAPLLPSQPPTAHWALQHGSQRPVLRQRRLHVPFAHSGLGAGQCCPPWRMPSGRACYRCCRRHWLSFSLSAPATSMAASAGAKSASEPGPGRNWARRLLGQCLRPQGAAPARHRCAALAPAPAVRLQPPPSPPPPPEPAGRRLPWRPGRAPPPQNRVVGTSPGNNHRQRAALGGRHRHDPPRLAANPDTILPGGN